MPHVVSVQVGKLKTYLRQLEDSEAKPWQSGFDKRPVMNQVEVDEMGLHGDAQGDTKNHGGVDKAVLFYALRHYADWNSAYPEKKFEPGAFGENLTVHQLNEADVCVGDIYQLGDVLLEISQPRVPCWKISERWQEPTLTDAVRETGRTGWYARVHTGGHVESGVPVVLQSRSYPGLTIEKLNQLLTGKRPWTDEICTPLRECPSLAAEWKRYIPQ